MAPSLFDLHLCAIGQKETEAPRFDLFPVEVSPSSTSKCSHLMFVLDRGAVGYSEQELLQ